MSENMNKDWVCSKCGTLNSSGNFCVECGEPKPASAVPPVAPAPAPVASESPAAFPAPTPAPAPTAKPKESPEDEKQANILCTVSVICMYATPVVAGILMRIVESIIYDSDVVTIVNGIISIIVGIAWIASIVLMILVRVKYPRNLFGKILMWVYIVQTILAVIGIIICILACAAFVHECSSSGAW